MIIQHSARALCAALLLTLCACGARPNNQTSAVQPTAAPEQVTWPEHPLVAARANDISPCEALQQPASNGSEPAGQSLAQPGEAIEVSYDGDVNAIVVHKGGQVTLAAVENALSRPELLRELSPGEWLLAADLHVAHDASLRIAAPEVRWLKLQSDASGFVALKALGGQIEFADTCVSSWDTEQNSYDENLADGRSFVLARDGARMDIHRSELRNLGFSRNESYGVSWRLAGTTGEITDSYLAYNYFGMYSYEASDLVIRGNEVHHNALYGLDPHTGSMRLTIEDNVVHNNGKHGIILADACSDGVIRNNVVYNNLHHGIVIYQHSNNNLVENNTLYGNAAHGINVNDASTNTVQNNTVYDNLEAGIGIGQQAAENRVIGNDVRANRKDGIVLYSEAERNTLENNTFSENLRYGIHVKSAGKIRVDGNTVAGNRVGVYLNVAPPPAVSEQSNQIQGNHEANLQVIPAAVGTPQGPS